MDWNIVIGITIIGALWVTIPLNIMLAFFSSDATKVRPIDFCYLGVFGIWIYVTIRIIEAALSR